MQNLVVLRCESTYADPPETWTHHVRILRSLKVIDTDTDRSAIYDFLLVKNGPIRTVFE